jgi:hypothetical protein
MSNPNLDGILEPAHEHVVSLAPRPCPTCDRPAPMTVRGEETCVGTLGPHDPNCVSGLFECENGHRFTATTQHVCSCGWSGVKVCTISHHDERHLRPPA